MIYGQLLPQVCSPFISVKSTLEFQPNETRRTPHLSHLAPHPTPNQQVSIQKDHPLTAVAQQQTASLIPRQQTRTIICWEDVEKNGRVKESEGRRYTNLHCLSSTYTAFSFGQRSSYFRSNVFSDGLPFVDPSAQASGLQGFSDRKRVDGSTSHLPKSPPPTRVFYFIRPV